MSDAADKPATTAPPGRTAPLTAGCLAPDFDYRHRMTGLCKSRVRPMASNISVDCSIPFSIRVAHKMKVIPDVSVQELAFTEGRHHCLVGLYRNFLIRIAAA